MAPQWTVFAGILFFNSVITTILAVTILGRRNSPGNNMAALMFFALTIWAAAYAMITLSPEMESKIFWLRIENLGIASVPVAWFLFALKYTQDNDRLYKVLRYILWIVPTSAWMLLFNSNWMHFYYSAIQQVDPNGGPLVISRGPWYMVELIHAYGLLAAGVGLLLWHMIRLRDLYRRQLILLIVGVIVPIIVNVLYQQGIGPFSAENLPVDLTPISLTITAGFISVGTFGLRMFDLVPIARNSVVDSIAEIVIVVDAYNRVVDVNQKAQDWLKMPSKDILGQDLMEIFKLWPGMAGRFLSDTEIRDEIDLPGTPPRTLEMIISPIFDMSGQVAGRIFVAHDISPRKEIENELKKANKSLKLQLAEIETLRLQLQEIADRDSLTGLYNRRYLENRLQLEMEKSKADDSELTIAILALNKFHHINRLYGHKAGDAALLNVAQTLTRKIAIKNVLCRYGGGRFVFILPETSLQEAVGQAEHWLAAAEATHVTVDKQDIPISVSIGLASSLKNGKDLELLLATADKALYQAQDSGKNTPILAIE